MKRILVSGLVNVETTLSVKGFPIDYYPVAYPFFGISSEVSGVAANIACALSRLGDDVRLYSMLGDDEDGLRARRFLGAAGVSDEFLDARLGATAQSVVIFDEDGRRQCHCDLKDIQEQSLSEKQCERLLAGVDAAVVCNVNFNRSLLRSARAMGVPIITDVHVLSGLDDEYNREFIEYADLLFLSDERLLEAPESFIRKLSQASRAAVIVIGLGKKGALCYDRAGDSVRLFDAVYTRPVVNTVGAGDALLSSFSHYYLAKKSADDAMRRACVFASYKIGENGASKGFADEKTIEQVMNKH